MYQINIQQCHHVQGNPQEACHYGPDRQLSWTYWCHCFEILSDRSDGCFHIMDALLFSDVAWLAHFLSPVTVDCRNSYSQSLWCVRCMRECPVWWTSWLSVGYCGNRHVQAICLELAMCILFVSNPFGCQQSCVCVSSAISSFWTVLASVMCLPSLIMASAHCIFLSYTE